MGEYPPRDEEIPGRTSERADAALAGDTNEIAVVRSGWDAHRNGLTSLALERHGRSTNGADEIDGDIGFHVVPACGPAASSAAGAEQVSHQIAEAGAAAAAAGKEVFDVES